MRTYTQRHSGTAIVCGGAPCVFEDLAKAKAMRPDAAVLGCNYAPTMIPEIKQVWSQEASRFGRMLKHRMPDVEIHTADTPQSGMEALYEADYCWPELEWVCGTSGFAAGLWAKHGLEYDEVILAGVPIERSMKEYEKSYASPFNQHNMPFAEDRLYEQWQQQIKSHKLNGKTEGIFSMSGYTRYMLGEPKE